MKAVSYVMSITSTHTKVYRHTSLNHPSSNHSKKIKAASKTTNGKTFSLAHSDTTHQTITTNIPHSTLLNSFSPISQPLTPHPRILPHLILSPHPHQKQPPNLSTLSQSPSPQPHPPPNPPKKVAPQRHPHLNHPHTPPHLALHLLRPNPRPNLGLIQLQLRMQVLMMLTMMMTKQPTRNGNKNVISKTN